MWGTIISAVLEASSGVWSDQRTGSDLSGQETSGGLSVHSLVGAIQAL